METITGARHSRTFRVVGRVAAGRLPEGMLVPGVLIRRDPSASRLIRPKNLLAESDLDRGGFLSAAPSEISIESDAVVEVRLHASDEADAIRVAQQKFIRPLVAALMLATGQPAHVELVRAAPEGPDGRVLDEGWSIWSDTGLMANLGAMPAMAEEERSTVLRTMQAFKHDKVAAAAAVDMVEAAKMAWTTGGRQAEVEASVLRMFLVIERIATRVASERRPDCDEQERQQRIVADLARDLRVHATTLAVRRIKNAAKALEQTEARRLSRDIAYTCDQLGLPDAVSDAAINLNKLRNQSLAHPGRSQAHHLLAEGADVATNTAEAFLREYAAWWAKNRLPT